MNTHISTIFFDLFGVLIGVDRSVFIQHLSKLSKYSYKKTKNIVFAENYLKMEKGDIKLNEYIESIYQIFSKFDTINKNDLLKIWTNSYIGEMPAVSIIKKLKLKYNVWIISNTTEKHIKKLKTIFDFLNNIDGIITSEVASAHKPNPAIFNYTLTKLKTDSFSSIFIDDSYINIEQAKKMGFTVHHYEKYENLLKFLNPYLKS